MRRIDSLRRALVAIETERRWWQHWIDGGNVYDEYIAEEAQSWLRARRSTVRAELKQIESRMDS